MAADQRRAWDTATKKGWDTVRTGQGRHARLRGLDTFGLPLYHATFNNSDAAATIGTSPLWPGGTGGTYPLNGSSSIVSGKIAVWDAGKPLDTHVELNNKLVRMDSAYNTGDGSDHATHVCGTVAARGVNPLAKGMANGLSKLLVYDYNNDLQEMAPAAAGGLLLSNHSYGDICGWNQNGFTGQWEFWGRANDNEDYKFGYYDPVAAAFDDLAFISPYYLIVKAVGNNRNSNGPAVGQPYNRFDSNGVMSDGGQRPAGISSNNAFGTIGTNGNAKNILSVGAVYPIVQGYTKPADVVITAFSSWGPTDDGRVKPDLVADGKDVLSCGAWGGNSYYAKYSGTSQAAPGIEGSLLLLQEYHALLHNGAFMKSATLKGLAIHTANEAGADAGPDYRFGWGLMNTLGAAKTLRAAALANNPNSGGAWIKEDTLANLHSDTLAIVAGANGPLKATLCWTDPAGTVDHVNVLNNPAPKLVNDLDLRIIAKTNGRTGYPWKLDGTNPAAPARKGDNTIDNVEVAEMDSITIGDTYYAVVAHKGTLTAAQPYSLIVSMKGDSALPIADLDLQALPDGKGNIAVLWRNILPEGQNCYVEHQAKNRSWEYLTSLKETDRPQGTYLHQSPPEGTHLYRMVCLDRNGKKSYSAVTSASLAGPSLFSVSPNPVAKGRTTVRLVTQGPRPHRIVLSDAFGRRLAHWESPAQTTLGLPATASGTCFLTAFFPDGSRRSEKLLILE